MGPGPPPGPARAPGRAEAGSPCALSRPGASTAPARRPGPRLTRPSAPSQDYEHGPHMMELWAVSRAPRNVPGAPASRQLCGVAAQPRAHSQPPIPS
jgi:hypothetical protein